MKNLTLFFFALMLVITACNDEEIVAPKNEKEAKVAESSSDPKFIVFESVSEYDSILDTLSNLDDSMLLVWAQGFTSYTCRLQTSTESQLEADGIYDELLATIISEQNIVQIAEHVFQLNFSTEEVYVLHQTDFDNPSDFNTENENMDVYSFGDDVLDEVANKTHNNCGKEKDGPDEWTPLGSGSDKLKRIVIYQRCGVYFSLLAKLKKNYRGELDYGVKVYRDWVSPADTFYYTKRNESREPIKIDMQEEDNNGKRRAYVIKKRPYKGSTPLTEFSFKANFWYSNTSGGGSVNDQMAINCGH